MTQQSSATTIHLPAVSIAVIHLLWSLLFGHYLFGVALASAFGGSTATSFFIVLIVVGFATFAPLVLLHFLNTTFLQLDMSFAFVIFLAIASSFLYGYGLAAFYRAWSRIWNVPKRA